MDGRAFLDAARDLASGTSEAHWRASVGRSYYALFHESRSALIRWGYTISPREAHREVRLKYLYASETDLVSLARDLETLGKIRNRADYDLSDQGFGSGKVAIQALRIAEVAIALLDAIEADPVRRASAIASIRP